MPRDSYKAAVKFTYRGQTFEAHGTQAFVEATLAKWLEQMKPETSPEKIEVAPLKA